MIKNATVDCCGSLGILFSMKRLLNFLLESLRKESHVKKKKA